MIYVTIKNRIQLVFMARYLHFHKGVFQPNQENLFGIFPSGLQIQHYSIYYKTNTKVLYISHEKYEKYHTFSSYWQVYM